MKSYIGIIYAKTNSLTAEKITIGVIFFSKKEAKIIFSERKIKLLEEFVNSNTSTFLKSTIHLFENKINEINKQLQHKDLNDTILTKEYFDYLHKYSQGILMFDKLKPIATKTDFQNIDNILYKFLGEKNYLS